jgi:hypothetical protein
MTLLIIWLLFGVASAMVANSKGRSGAGFFILGVLLGPIGLLGAAVAGKDTSRETRAGLQSGALRPCPHCAEPIRREASACRFCGRDVPVLPKLGLFGREIT